MTPMPTATGACARLDPVPTRVLLIEDDADLRGALAERLREDGFDVMEAAEGGEGLRLQRERPATVVVTDIFMPGQEGMETIWALREASPAARIVAISAGMARGKNYDVLGIARMIGADRCLMKPFDADDLVAAIREISA